MSELEPYVLTFEDRTTYFYVHALVHQVDEKMYSSCVTKMINACRKAGRDKLLIDREVDGVVPAAIVLLQVRYLNDVAEGLKVAIVDSDRANAAEIARNISLLNTGEGRVKMFATQHQAESWLELPAKQTAPALA